MTLSQGMTDALAAADVALAIRGAIAPRAAAASYGIPIPDGVPPTPYLEVKVNRDFVLAGLLVVVAASGGSSVLSAALFVGTIAPLADAFEVGRHGKASGTGIHLGTAAYMVVAAFLALSGR